MSKRPVIGIAAYREQARWNIWDTDATVIHQSFVRGVTEAGGRAVVLPPDDQDADVLDRLDGLLLPGGVDIDPARYGQDRHPATDRARPDRDAGELLLLDAALERDLPVLGVCRGLQLLALLYGGTLHQHLPDVLGHSRHQPREGVLGEHEVIFAAGSRAAAVYGSSSSVNSHHHQGIADPGRLWVTAHSDDGLPEAVEDPDRRWVLGVQWHPELSGGRALFAAFVSACHSAPPTSVLDGSAGTPAPVWSR
ncbi:gamma-glutamyl-gamma-aminobutyrate hydrolase family protein [Streptomyces sp. NBC_00151]|uniref:gamma-glutamyl-gamma-aminobutyrate hydrolase family protein n=1 Tax=Streptomyces sp. NBC_00151 TaxID=2975669 RepID=UPI002DD9C93E|nr:gamma-glutamyl-gamma-aminobutyrate hydrolase family protein [Streptomyces sp. NBC_00151]WRZ37333.1 gamma-glutamyl-gamma-aminobutyrate hydrolase family protein [Streptomyces sp. NBC_00151]